jgi:hypothetical protein
MSILSPVNYRVDPTNIAYPPCVGGGYVGVPPGTQSNKLPTIATLVATGPTFTVTPFEQLPLMLLLVGNKTANLDATKLYKEAHNDSATAADKANQLLIDIPDPSPGTPVNVNVWLETVGGINMVYVEPR